MAEGLQRSLLTAPVEPDHVQVVVRYQPAAKAAQVGGDWYDAFLTPDGSTVLVIGDVMGHDIAAAAGMSQVRSLLRGIAYTTGASPAVVLAGLDAAMQGLAVDTTATVVVGRLEQAEDERHRDITRFRWANAGHPAPILVTPDGTVSALAASPPELLLGIEPGTRRSDAAITVDRGSTLLMFTDGLVERRDRSLDEGLIALREAVAELAAETLDELVDGVLRRMLPGEHEDDVALVAVRLHHLDRERPPEAGPQRTPSAVPPVPAASAPIAS
jgi:serine phosphatase RsbU (regulator of sigma subunit)